MANKKIRYNSVTLEFTEETRGHLTVLTAPDPNKQITVRNARMGDGAGLFKFQGHKTQQYYHIVPSGAETSITDVVALAQCFYASRHLDDIGDLTCMSYVYCGDVHDYTFERDSKYDQPILIYLEQLKCKESAHHGS